MPASSAVDGLVASGDLNERLLHGANAAAAAHARRGAAADAVRAREGRVGARAFRRRWAGERGLERKAAAARLILLLLPMPDAAPLLMTCEGESRCPRPPPSMGWRVTRSCRTQYDHRIERRRHQEQARPPATKCPAVAGRST